MGITEDQVRIEENLMSQTTKVLNREVEKIGDIGEIADLLEILNHRLDSPIYGGKVYV